MDRTHEKSEDDGGRKGEGRKEEGQGLSHVERGGAGGRATDAITTGDTLYACIEGVPGYNDPEQVPPKKEWPRCPECGAEMTGGGQNLVMTREGVKWVWEGQFTCSKSRYERRDCACGHVNEQGNMVQVGCPGTALWEGEMPQKQETLDLKWETVK